MIVFLINTFLSSVLNHAPDLRKNESMEHNDSRKQVASASDKASRYFSDLQHLRKKFWERYRHLLIPMIRTQIQKSGTKRLTRTATNLGLRQTKRADSGFLHVKRADSRSTLRPMASSKQDEHLSSSIMNDFEVLMDSRLKPTKKSNFEKMRRFGRSSLPTSFEGMEDVRVKNDPFKNKIGKDVSMVHFLAYSLLSK